MDPYTTRGEARIRQRDVAAALRIDGVAAAGFLAALERQRGRQAEVEVAGLLKRHGVTPSAGSPLVALFRRTIAAALVQAGRRLAGTPGRASSMDTSPAAGTPAAAG
jgi:hypothetical protein